MSAEWGPLADLAGEWEGVDGFDTVFSRAAGRVIRTPYRERVTFVPFGPVHNGEQRVYGLDYRTAMWRGNEALPFHAEVGYWTYDVDTAEILRAFVVPRGITVLAGGRASSDDVEFTLAADAADRDYTIGESQFLTKRASSTTYRVSVRLHGDAGWSYEQVTTLAVGELAEPFADTDRNVLRRVN